MFFDNSQATYCCDSSIAECAYAPCLWGFARHLAFSLFSFYRRRHFLFVHFVCFRLSCVCLNWRKSLNSRSFNENQATIRWNMSTNEIRGKNAKTKKKNEKKNWMENVCGTNEMHESEEYSNHQHIYADSYENKLRIMFTTSRLKKRNEMRRRRNEQKTTLKDSTFFNIYFQV